MDFFGPPSPTNAKPEATTPVPTQPIAAARNPPAESACASRSADKQQAQERSEEHQTATSSHPQPDSIFANKASAPVLPSKRASQTETTEEPTSAPLENEPTEESTSDPLVKPVTPPDVRRGALEELNQQAKPKRSPGVNVKPVWFIEEAAMKPVAEVPRAAAAAPAPQATEPRVRASSWPEQAPPGSSDRERSNDGLDELPVRELKRVMLEMGVPYHDLAPEKEQYVQRLRSFILATSELEGPSAAPSAAPAAKQARVPSAGYSCMLPKGSSVAGFSSSTASARPRSIFEDDGVGRASAALSTPSARSLFDDEEVPSIPVHHKPQPSRATLFDESFDDDLFGAGPKGMKDHAVAAAGLFD